MLILYWFWHCWLGRATTHVQQSETMAFGDSFNDIHMIRLAGIGVAMGNSEDEIKQVADYVTLDNNHDGVAHALEHFRLEIID